MVYLEIFIKTFFNFSYTEAKNDLGSEEKTERTDRMKREAHNLWLQVNAIVQKM